MPAIVGVLVAAAAAADGDVASLEHVWSGVRDSSEQVVMSVDAPPTAWPQANERRVRTVVAPVDIAWLGAHVLYLEEFLEDEGIDSDRLQHLRDLRQLAAEVADGAEDPNLTGNQSGRYSLAMTYETHFGDVDVSQQLFLVETEVRRRDHRDRLRAGFRGVRCELDGVRGRLGAAVREHRHRAREGDCECPLALVH